MKAEKRAKEPPVVEYEYVLTLSENELAHILRLSRDREAGSEYPEEYRSRVCGMIEKALGLTFSEGQRLSFTYVKETP